jgi:hypothetical protein
MKTKNIVMLVGTLIIAIAITLAVIWFGWKLAIVIYVALMGNNIENFGRTL